MIYNLLHQAFADMMSNACFHLFPADQSTRQPLVTSGRGDRLYMIAELLIDWSSIVVMVMVNVSSCHTTTWNSHASIA